MRVFRRKGTLIRRPWLIKPAEFVVAVLLSCAGLPTNGAAQAPGEAVIEANDVVAGTDARDGVDSPSVIGKTYGGKASAAYVVRKRTAIRRQAAKAVPKTGDAFRDWINGASALGDWAGRRRTLESRGVTISGFSATAVLGNATGGARRSWTAANSTLVALDLDFDKLVGWSGFLIHAEGWWAGGNNLSDAGRIDNLFNVASIYTPNGLYLGQLYAEQGLFDQKLVLQVGRIATANNFASLPVAADYVSAAMNGVPVSLPINTVPFTQSPASQWGVVATVAPLSAIELTAGVYNADRRSSELNGTHGVDFGLNLERGVMVIGQASYLREQAKHDRGLPGIYSFGGFRAGDNYQRIDGSGDKDGNFGFYAMGQQMVYREGGPGSAEGLTFWLAVAYQPQQSINLLPVFLSGGAVYEGLLRGRDTDTAAFAVYHGKLSNDLEDTSSETVLELNYTFWATPWLGLTPDFQYVFNPGGASNNDAAVFGGQIMINF